MTLRIAVDARPLAQPRSGIGRYTLRLLEQLHAFPNVQLVLYGCKPDNAQALSRVEIRPDRYRTRAIDQIWAQTAFRRWSREDRVDLYWSPRHHLPILPIGIPTVVTIHDLVWKRAATTMTAGGWLLERLLMPQSLRQAERILVPSRASADDLNHFFPDVADRVRVVPLGRPSEPGDVARLNHTDNPYALFVGTLEPRKNLERSIRAFIRARQATGARHRLVIAGRPGWRMRQVKRALNTPEAVQSVEYVGSAEDAQLFDLYRGADFLLAPSLYEGFGLQVLEALSFGVPVVTSSTSSLPEVAGNAGLLVDPLDEESIADAIARLILDRPLREHLGREAHKQAARFSWQRTALETLSVFQEALISHTER